MALSAFDKIRADRWMKDYGRAKAETECARGFRGRHGADRNFPAWCADWGIGWNTGATTTTPPPQDPAVANAALPPSSGTPTVVSADFVPVGTEPVIAGASAPVNPVLADLLKPVGATVAASDESGNTLGGVRVPGVSATDAVGAKPAAAAAAPGSSAGRAGLGIAAAVVVGLWYAFGRRRRKAARR